MKIKSNQRICWSRPMCHGKASVLSEALVKQWIGACQTSAYCEANRWAQPQSEGQSLYLAGSRVTIERGGRLVIDSLSFRVDAGTALVITGPNGAGKSTLLRAIAGLVHRTSGTIVLEGGDAERTVPEQCHYLGHLDGLKTALTVAENAAFWRDFYGARGDDVNAALAEVGLDHLGTLPAAYLSAGQRRRLSLARLLVSQRPVWLLDEPTSALDAASETRFIDLVNRHLTNGGLVIAATHGPLGFQSVTRLDLAESMTQ